MKYILNRKGDYKMIEVNIRGIVTEICWKGEKSCKFIIENEQKSLLCTITRRRMHLADRIVVGEEYNFIGDISAFRKNRDTCTIIENTFFITAIE
jgi:hypothetical protein